MKLALIPPISWLPTTTVTDYQLMLPHLIGDYHSYADHYRALAKRKDQYVILDNGEAEQKRHKFSFAQLVGMGIYAEVDEVVVPDVIGDSVETLNNMQDFFRDIYDLRNDAFSKRQVENLKYMGVIQGKSYDELQNCVDMMMKLHGKRLTTLALPRHTLETTGDHTIRLSLANYIRETYPSIEIHCLGTSHLWPREVIELARQEIVRGIDTSMPFNWAYQSAYLNDEVWAIKRPLRYFSRPARNFDQDALHYNIGLLRRWARGDDDVRRA